MAWVVDIREPEELVAYMKEKGAKVEKLQVGDYTYEGMVGFERKSYDFLDFTRMVSQVDELVDTYAFPFLVVDLSLTDLIKHAQKQFHKNMLPSIMGVTASLAVRGCPPIFCGTKASMLVVMDKIAKKSVDGKDRSAKRSLRTQHLDSENPVVNVIRGFKIGVTKAEDIAEHFDNDLQDILDTFINNPEELKEVEGIGDKTINKITEIIHGKEGETQVREVFF